MARALYQQTDLLFLDDPLSAVDALVGAKIFDKAIGPNSMSRLFTRILVTHSLACLPQTDYIVVMKDGEIVRIGTYQELLDDEEMVKLIRQMEKEEEGTSRKVGSSDSGNLEESDTEYSSTEDSPVVDRKKSKASSKVGDNTD